jgi:hypothetical protein
MGQSPPYLHPFVCFVCRRSFRRPAVDRDEATCPVCGGRAIRLSRKFKPPPQSDVQQWAKVESLVRLGFRFDTTYDGEGAIVPYPRTERGIPAFVERIAAFTAPDTARRRSGAEFKGRPTQTRNKRQTKKARQSKED